MAEYKLAAFVCAHESSPVASACCRVWRSPYPEVLSASQRKIGYIWSVYTEEKHQGAAGHDLDASLHRPPAGHQLYLGGLAQLLCRASKLPELGFTETHERHLPFAHGLISSLLVPVASSEEAHEDDIMDVESGHISAVGAKNLQTCLWRRCIPICRSLRVRLLHTPKRQPRQFRRDAEPQGKPRPETGPVVDVERHGTDLVAA